MNLLVTGGNGYFGSLLVNHLVESADHVRVLDIDPTGTHFINLSSPLTSRDNNRQAASDLNVFSKTIKTLDLTGDAVADIDPNRVHFTGLSLGAMVGTVASKFTDLVTVTASAPHRRKFLVLPLADARIIVTLLPLTS